jgi:hypothetical protein
MKIKLTRKRNGETLIEITAPVPKPESENMKMKDVKVII